MTTPFTSFRYPFVIDQARGRVGQESNFNQHIEQLVKQLLLTSPGERLNRPDFGCGVRRLVFAPGGDVAASLARSVIYQSLTKWLGNAVKVQDVTVNAVDSTLSIYISYQVLARGEQRYLNIQVTA